MPITLDRFTNLSKLNAEERAVMHLFFHDKGYKAAELAEELGLARGTIDHALSDLKKWGLVENKTPYWAITEESEDEALEFLKEYDVLEKATPPGVSVDVKRRTVVLNCEAAIEGEIEEKEITDFWE